MPKLIIKQENIKDFNNLYRVSKDNFESHIQIMKRIIPRHNIYAKHITLVSKNSFVQTVPFLSYHTILSSLQKMKFFRSLFIRKNDFLRKFFYND